MQFTATKLAGAWIVEPQLHEDSRGSLRARTARANLACNTLLSSSPRLIVSHSIIPEMFAHGFQILEEGTEVFTR